ncbi:hypothetical protein [Streptomyces albidochromogenes]|uniref:Uncharacterized protein n=1 Tax=Streptomyces albidochromogenes TaxID=329524 RepID=A0ABW6FQD3_9ACTN
MKKNRLAAGGAAAAIAVGLAVGAAAPASAAPTERIGSLQELHAHVAKAVALESAQAGTLGDPVGQKVTESVES